MAKTLADMTAEERASCAAAYHLWRCANENRHVASAGIPDRQLSYVPQHRKGGCCWIDIHIHDYQQGGSNQ